MRPTRIRDFKMKREDAIINAQMVMNYLAIYERQAYLTLDISRNDVRLHYFDPDSSDDEVEWLAKKLDAIRMVGTELEIVPNNKVGTLTFNVIWEL